MIRATRRTHRSHRSRRSIRAAGGLALLALSPAFVACGDDAEAGACNYPGDDVGLAPRDVDRPSADPTVEGELPARLTLGDGQVLELTLDADTAPCTVGSFVSLAEQGYYDGTTCHRLTTPPASISVLQCGDPSGTGTGGPGYTIPDELDGIDGYPAGTVAMANRGAADSGGSQFFLVYADSALPPDYTVFATLSPESLSVLEAIGAAGTDNGMADGAPATPVDLANVVVS